MGPSGKRCKEDEKLINAVLGPGKRGYIIDTRSQTLAQTAKVTDMNEVRVTMQCSMFGEIVCACLYE